MKVAKSSGLFSCLHFVLLFTYPDACGQGILREGTLEHAEPNSIVMLFPQSSSTVDSGGCWDFEGEINEAFDTHDGVQLRTVVNMIQSLDKLELIEYAGNSSDL